MLWDQNQNCHHIQGAILSHLTAALTSKLSFLLSLLANLTWRNNVSVFFLKQLQSVIPKTIIHFVFHVNVNTLWAILPSGPTYCHGFISIVPILIQSLITTEELYKKRLNDLDNHKGVVTYLEPDILECEVR